MFEFVFGTEDVYLPINQLTYLNFLTANKMLCFRLDVFATETKNTTRVFTETIILTPIYWL